MDNEKPKTMIRVRKNDEKAINPVDLKIYVLSSGK